MSLSITTAWNQTAEFVRRDAGAVFPIALALIALPQVLFQAFTPALVTPEDSSWILSWLFLLLVMMALSIVGSIAISALALGRENVVGSAIGRGLRRLPAMLGASLLVGLGAFLLLLPLLMATGIRPEDMQTPAAATAGKLALVILVFLLVLLVIWVKLMLMTPIAAAEAGGPIALLRRSWQLTGGHFLKLLGFALLFLIAVLVVVTAVTAVLGIVLSLVGEPNQPGSLANLVMLLVSGLINAVVVVLFTTMVARIYAQLTGPASADVFQ